MNHLCKTITYTLTLLCVTLIPHITSAAFADEYEYGWTQSMGGTGNDQGYSITTDSSDNMYITGYFSGTVDFDLSEGVDTKISAGAIDIFITKLSPDGSYQWTKTMGGAGNDQGSSITTDSSDNVYVTGQFTGTVDFDPSEGVDTKTSAGSGDIFITKLSPDGSYQWTKTMGGVGSDISYSITTDSSDNVYVTGQFSGTVDFDPSEGVDTKISAGSEDIFITKLSPDGSYQWTKTMGGQSSFGDSGYSVTTDSSDNIYITGYFSGTVDFDLSEGVDTKISAGAIDIFITKLSPDGSYQWTKTMGGQSIFGDLGYSVTTDSSNNLYLTGLFSGTVDFDPSEGIDTKISKGSRDIFITKLSPDGSYQWTKTMGGAGYDQGSSITTDSSDNVYVTGQFTGTVDFDPSEGIDTKISKGSRDIFITKLSPDGSYQWTKTMGGTGYGQGLSITIDSLNNVHVTGSFSGTVDFDPSEGIDTKISAGSEDIFITKLSRILPPEPEQEEEEQQPTPRRRSGSKITPPTALAQPTTPVSSTPSTLPTTIPELQTLITQLQTQIQELLANNPSALNNPTSTTFTRDLYADISGEDVRQLQILLNQKGYIVNTLSNPGAPGYESPYFGNKTQEALIKFQQDNNITPAAGYFGPVTRGKIVR